MGIRHGTDEKGWRNVRFSGKTNWSKLVKVSGRDNTTYYLQCECGKTWSGHNGYEELEKLHNQHMNEEVSKTSTPNDPNKKITLEDISNATGGCLHTGYKTWSVTVMSN